MEARSIGWAIAVNLTLAAASPAAAAPDALATVIAAKTLKVGVALNTPWVIRKPDGSYAGYDIDVANALAAAIGVTPTFIQMPFSSLIPNLMANKVDVIASGLAITPVRARTVVFSNSMGSSNIRVVVSTRLPGSDPSTAVAQTGVRIAALNGSTGEVAATVSFPKAVVTGYPTMNEALAALLAGKADAMVATSPFPRLAAKLYDQKLKLLDAPLTRTVDALAFRPDEDRLRLYVNNWVDARRADGYLDNVRHHWFETFEWLSDFDTSGEATIK